MPVFSVHTFMLPMRWDYLQANFDPSQKRKGEIPFDERTQLQKFVDLLTPDKTGAGNKWERKFYRIKENAKNYNELIYYHAHASNNFFDLQREDEKDQFTVSKNKVALYFEVKNIDPSIDYYKIYVKKGPPDISKDYELKLSGISLHVFTTGVCILSYTLENDKFPEAHDILFINEFGRRIYPPFIEDAGKLDQTKEKVLAEKIEIKIASFDNSPLVEDFKRYNDFKANAIETHQYENGNYKYNTIIDFPLIVRNLFDNNKFAFTAKEEDKRELISFRLLTSDRMYFQCWYGNNAITETVRKELETYDGSKTYMFAQCKFWYAFMYGDRAEGKLGIGNKYFMERQLLENTYTRWAEYGTLYGFTNDSFVCLSENLKTLKDNDVPDLSLHMQTIYYTMAVLNLVQRASALRFSGEVATLADLGKCDGKDISTRIQDLNLNYIEFINKVYYREISPEIQGIEIYNHFQKAMNIEDDVNDLKMEIGELYQYVSMVQDKERNDEAGILNKVAFVFLPISVVFGILGSSFFSDDLSWVPFSGWSWKPVWGILFGLILSGILYLLLHIYYKNHINNKKAFKK
jgi:hypothetical protein